MTIHYKAKRFSESIGEIKELLDNHYDELSVTKNYPLNPDYDFYMEVDKQGNVRTALCYDDEILIGYIIYFIGLNLHYKDCLLATEDIYYLKPEYRKGTTGIKMFKFAEKYLKTLGVNMIKYSTKVHMDNSKLFEYLDCKLIEKVFVKNLE